MDLSAALTRISWLSIAIATLSAFMIGGVWYGPLFGRAWMKANRFTEEDLAGRNMSRVFALSLALVLIATVNLEMFIGPQAGPGFGFGAGLLAGFGWVATFLGVIYLFEGRSLALWGINAGYSIGALSVIGALLGAI